MTTPAPWRRREFIAAAGISLATTRVYSRTRGLTVSAQIRTLEGQIGGRVGVAILDPKSGAHLSHRGDERFAMCSTFKWMLAGAILAKVDRGEIALETVVRYTADDVLSNSPVTELQVGAGSMTIEALCQSAVEVSDNTAANLLLPLIGNPSGLTAYLRTLGDRVTRLDRNETGLNTNVQGDARDTTTPNSMVKIMRELLVRDALSPKSKDKLIGWMKNCRTGTARIRAGLPPTWIAGDKTGTGANGAVNDVAIIWPPNHTAILVAAYLTGSLSPLDTLNAVQSTIGAIVTKQFAI